MDKVMTGLTFEEETHTYRWNGEIVPSVNQILEAEGIRPPYSGDRWYGERGTYVHQATALYDRGELDEESLDPQLKGYVEAWKKFREEEGFTPRHIEEAFCHEGLGFAGTIDRTGVIRRERPIIIDIKTGAFARWMSIQLNAYQILIEGHGSLLAVRLNRDGTYQMKYYEDEEDTKIFLAALNLYKWKNKFKREPK